MQGKQAKISGNSQKCETLLKQAIKRRPIGPRGLQHGKEVATRLRRFRTRIYNTRN